MSEAPLPARAGSARARSIASGAALVLLLACVAPGGFQPIRSYDYFWHLAAGEQILETGAVPRHDTWSLTARGERWVDSHWLFQAGVAAIHDVGGHPAVRVARGVCVLAMMAALALLAGVRTHPASAALAVGLALPLLYSRLLVRPDVISFGLLVATLALLRADARCPGRRVWWMLPLLVLWANVHGLFALGLALVGLALAGELARGLASGAPAVRRDRALRLALVLGAGLAVTFLNPNGPELHRQVLQQLGMIGGTGDRDVFGIAIQELRPTLGAGARGLSPVLLLAAVLLAGGAAFALARDRRRASAFEVLALVAFAFLAIQAQRNLSLLAVVAAPLLGTHLAPALGPLARRPAAIHLGRGVALAGLLAFAGFAFATRSPDAGDVGAGPAGLAPFHYPVAAVDWIEAERPPGPIFHRLGDGGYLIWRLEGAYPVLIDGRLEVHGPERFADTELATGPVGFQALDDRHAFGMALLHHALLPDLELVGWLAKSPRWRLVHLDESASLFVRARPGAPDGDPERLLPPLPPGTDPDGANALDRWRRLARIEIFVAYERYARARHEAREASARHPDTPAVARWLRWLEREAPR